MKIPLLMYHSIKAVDNTEIMRSLHVSPRSFAKQMYLLKLLGFKGASVSQCMEALKQNTGERLVGLTFDDGYSNFFTCALPILRNLDFSATVYVIPGHVASYNVWDEGNGISQNSLMNWDEIKACKKMGIEIGCHSMDHSSLVQPNIDITRNINEAKDTLDKQLNHRTTTFCYPYGHFNDSVIKATKEAGFVSATTMIRSRATSQDDPFSLPRIPINWHTWPHLFLAKVLTNYEDRRRGR